MEFISNKRERVATTSTKSSLVVCFFISTGICLAFTQVLPQNPKDNNIKPNYLHYGILRIVLALVVLMVEVFIFWTIRKRNRFHRNQQAFWPLLCRHCAQVIGLSDDNMSARNEEGESLSTPQTTDHQEQQTCDNTQQVPCADKTIYPQVLSRNSRTTAPSQDHFTNTTPGPRNDHPSTSFSSQPIVQLTSKNDLNGSREPSQEHKHCGYNNQHLDDVERELSQPVVGPPPYQHLNIQNNYRKERLRTDSDENYERRCSKTGQLYMYRKPHMSLLKTFSVFGVIAVLSIPIQLIGLIIFLFNYSGNDKWVALIGQVLQDFSFITLIFFAIAFFAYYYGAVFVEQTSFSYTLGIATVASMYVVSGKILYPVGNAVGNLVNNPGYLYKLNGTFGDFLLWHEAFLTPFYIELGIIATSMMWQIWGSVYPPPCFRIQECIIEDLDIRPWISCERWNNRRKGRLTPPSIETQSLLKDNISFSNNRTLCKKTGICCTIFCLVYFVFSQYLAHSTIYNSPESKIYIQWSVEIAFTLPFLALCRYQTFISKSSIYYYVKRNVSIPNGLLGSHDKVLLLSSVGVFTLSSFRLFAVLSILFNSTLTADGEVLALACFGLVYAVFKVVSIFIITLLLIVVQRQHLSKKAEIKWTLVTLICMTFLNATLWLMESLDRSPWAILKLHYGDVVGNLIGVFLEPLCDLYGLHAAMVSYEAYKELSAAASSSTEEKYMREESAD